MALILNDRALWLHVPKTGGNWCKRAFEVLGIKATPLYDVPVGQTSDHGIPRGNTLPVIAGVRHPLTWYESWWRYNNARNWPDWEVGSWHPQRCLFGCGDASFDAFMENVLRKEPSYVTRLYEWYHGPPDTRGVYAVRQEDIRGDLVRALSDFCVIDYDRAWRKLRDLAPVNASRGALVIWNPRIKEDVLRTECSVLKRFGYDEGERGNAEKAAQLSMMGK